MSECPHCGKPMADVQPGWRHTCAQGIAARQRAQDIATAGNWHLLTDEDVERIDREVEVAGGWEVLTREQAGMIFRGTGPITKDTAE